MSCGRTAWRPGDVATDAGVARVLAVTQQSCYEHEDPMDWIVENRARSSPFWRTVRRVAELSYPESPYDWYNHVTWTNIYPVALNDVKGNPEGTLRAAQSNPAAQLLDAVAEAVNPDAVIVLGGGYWWDVAPALPLDNSRSVERPLLAVGKRNGVPWVIGWHPGGAQRRGWSSARYAEVILEASTAQR